MELRPLSRLRSTALEPVLAEATLAWRERLAWDFHASAGLVRHYVDVQILNGYALLDGDQAVGYSYYVLDERKGLIGDLFVRRAWRTPAAEHRLLEAVVDALIGSPVVRRIESQLMMFDSARAAGLPFSHFSRAFPRNFMLADLAQAARLPVGAAAGRYAAESWAEQFRDDAARLIAAAYAGHIDSQINDQYNSLAGARRFLHNIVEYPGCGKFFQPASFVAFDHAAGAARGLSLASLVASDVGHITQVCVHPSARNTGAGYELLRRSLAGLAAHGCRQVSLTVTAANTSAIQLYERMGFRTAYRFDALIWSGF